LATLTASLPKRSVKASVSISSSLIAPLIAGFPGVVLGVFAKLRHHVLGEQFKRVADVLVAVLAGLVEQDHLVDM